MAQCPQVVSYEDADKDKNGDENPEPKPKRQPISVKLAEFVEPINLQRYRQRGLETYDAENGNRDIGEVAIEAVQEHDRRTASLRQDCAAEGERGEKHE